jgi:hypothetical protein
MYTRQGLTTGNRVINWAFRRPLIIPTCGTGLPSVVVHLSSLNLKKDFRHA